MARMLLDSIEHAEEDMAVRALLEARNEANNILLAADKFLRQQAGALSEEERQRTQALADQLRKLTEGDDKDAINRAIEEINEYTRPLAQKAMDQTIAEAVKGKKI